MKIRLKVFPAPFSIAGNRISRLLLQEQAIVWILSLFFISINTIRVIRLPLTHDEAPSRSDLLQTYSDYILLTRVTANTHILNSVLRKFFIGIFSNTPFFLRLDNLLAHIVFLIFSYKLTVRLFEGKWWRIMCFLLMNLNPFLFEFWGLSRGYGLAIAFMTASIYYMTCYIMEDKGRWLALSLLLAIGSVYSNFSLLNYFMALSCFVFIYGLWITSRLYPVFFKRDLPVWMFAALLLYLLVAGPIQKLNAANEFYYGGEKGLIHDTVFSLVRESMYQHSDHILTIWSVIYPVSAIVIAAAIYWLWVFLKKGQDRNARTGIFLCCLLVVPLISIDLQNRLLGTKYLIDRTALFLYVLFVLLTVISLYRFRKAKITFLTLTFFTLLSAYNFAIHITLSQSRSWWTDNYNLLVLNRVLHDHKARPGQKIKMRVNWIFMPSLSYYTENSYAGSFEPFIYTKDAPQISDTSFDYMYLTGSDLENISDRYITDTILHYGQFHLLKKK